MITENMSKSKEQCFRILGLPLGAGEKDIKDAYKRKALELHPDKNPEDPEAAKERFQELQEAFSCLVKEERKEPNITLDMWVLIMMEIERQKEMEKRREIERMLRLGFFDFDDHGYGYTYGRRNRPFCRATPESSRIQRNHWESNHFSDCERQTESENAGSTVRKSKFTSDHNISNNCSSFDSDWLPEQAPTRSAKRKKKNKKNQKHQKERKVKKIVKEQYSRKRTQNESTEKSCRESDEESLTCTVDSVDSNIYDEPNEENVERIPKDNPEKIKNNTGTNLSTGNVFSHTKKCRQKIQNTEKDPKNSFINDIKENNSKINKMNSNTSTSKKEKAKANGENVSKGKRCPDTDTRNTSSNWKNNDKTENKEKDCTMMKTCNDSRINAERFTNDSSNGDNVNEDNDEHLYKGQKENFLKQANSGKEEDWSKWKFPSQTTSNATIIASGQEKKPKSTLKDKRSGKVSKSTNQERTGENVPTKFTNKERDDKKIKSTNVERDGEEVINPSKSERRDYEAKNSSVGKINQELPDSYYIADIGVISNQNAQRDLKYEKIKERYGSYIDKLIDPNRTERYNKLIETAVCRIQDVNRR